MLPHLPSDASAGSNRAALRPLTVVSADVPVRCAEAVMDVLMEEGVSATIWEDWEQGASRIEIFLETSESPDDARTVIKRAGAACGLQLEPVVSSRPAEEWSESWKRFFHTTRISPRLVVRPPWESYAVQADEQVVIMDPGMSFGTGLHGTTQACMQMLDELAQESLSRRVLDIGCGSGILSIAAAKLGFTNVCGYDYDPDAVRIAQENAVINDVTVAFSAGDLATDSTKGVIVVANVLAGVLCQYAAQVAAAVSDVPGHALLLSGILDVQYAEVVERYAQQGFREIRNILIGEWRSGWFMRG